MTSTPAVIKDLKAIRADVFNGLEAYKGEFSDLLPRGMTVASFILSIKGSLAQNPKLLECTRDSILTSALKAAQWGLELDTAMQHAHLVPFKNKDGDSEAVLVPGYRGLRLLADRCKIHSWVDVRIIYENDVWSIRHTEEGTKLSHEEELLGPRGKAKVWYAVFHRPDGSHRVEVMTLADINKVKGQSQARGSADPWQKHFEEMGKKTVFKRGMKYEPLSSNSPDAQTLADAIRSDNMLEAGTPDPAPKLTPVDEDSKTRADQVADAVGAEAEEVTTAPEGSPGGQTPEKEESPPAATEDAPTPCDLRGCHHMMPDKDGMGVCRDCSLTEGDVATAVEPEAKPEPEKVDTDTGEITPPKKQLPGQPDRDILETMPKNQIAMKVGEVIQWLGGSPFALDTLTKELFKNKEIKTSSLNGMTKADMIEVICKGWEWASELPENQAKA